MEQIKTHTIKSYVLWSRFISSKIVLFITANKQLKSIEIESGDIIISTKIEDIDLDYTDATILSPDGAILIYPTVEGGYVFFSLKDRVVVDKIEKLEDKPTSCVMDGFSRYFCVGFESGKSDVFFYKTLELCNKPPAHTDTVLFCSFFSYGKLFLTCGMDGKITISDFDAYSPPFRAKLSESKIVGAAQLDDTYMVASLQPDTLLFFNVVEKKITKRIQIPFIKSLTLIAVKNEKRYLFYVKDERKIGIIDLKERVLLADNLIDKGSDVTSLSITEEGIIALFLKRGELLIFKLFEASELKKLLLQEEYKKAYDLVEKNPLLKSTQEYATLERVYEDRFSSGFKLLCRRMYDDAKATLAPFADIPEKRGRIQKVEREFEHFDEFLEMIKDKNYVRVYGMVEGKEFLQETPEFLALEKRWVESYKKAQEYILKNADTASARGVLNDFYNVPQKRQLIHNLLRNPTLFIELKSAMKNRSFYEFFALVAKNRFLKDSPEYKSVIEYGNKLYDTINKKLKNRIFNNILEEIDELEAFPELEEKLKGLKEFSLVATQFLRSFQSKNYPKCFELIDANPILHGFSEAKGLEIEWRNELNKAQNFALKGDIEGVQTTLFKYLNISTRIPAIGMVLKRAYISQLKKALIKEESDLNVWEGAINKFLAIFGYDDELDNIIKRLKEREIGVLISKSQETKAEPTHWYAHTKGNLPLDIFE